VQVRQWQTDMRNESNSGRKLRLHYPPANILREKGLSVSPKRRHQQSEDSDRDALLRQETGSRETRFYSPS